VTKEEEALELYINQLTEKIQNLDRNNTMLQTRVVMLEKENKELSEKVNQYEIINKKKVNKVTGFSHKKTIKGR